MIALTMDAACACVVKSLMKLRSIFTKSRQPYFERALEHRFDLVPRVRQHQLTLGQRVRILNLLWPKAIVTLVNTII